MALFQIVVSTLCKEDVTDKLLTKCLYWLQKQLFWPFVSNNEVK